MSTYVTKRGSIWEAIAETRQLYFEKYYKTPDTLLLGEGCRLDLGAETCHDVSIHPEQASEVVERVFGMPIKWVPGNDIMVGNFVSLQ